MLRVLLLTLLSCPQTALGIVNGNVMTSEQEVERPWHVALVHYAEKRHKTRISEVYCGGTLVSRR